MFIVDKQGEQVANTEHVVFFSLIGTKINFMLEKGVVLTLGKYETEIEAAEMFVALCRAIEQDKKLFRMYKIDNENQFREKKESGTNGSV